MKIVCLGDSLTYGFGVRRSKIWTKLAQDKLGIEIINEGINGDTSGGMLSRFQDAVSSKRPDAVLIMGGANDLIVGADLGVVKANIMSMAHQSIAKYIDFYDEFEKSAGLFAGDYYTDGLHFNEQGNEILSEIFCQAIENFKNK